MSPQKIILTQILILVSMLLAVFATPVPPAVFYFSPILVLSILALITATIIFNMMDYSELLASRSALKIITALVILILDLVIPIIVSYAVFVILQSNYRVIFYTVSAYPRELLFPTW